MECIPYACIEPGRSTQAQYTSHASIVQVCTYVQVYMSRANRNRQDGSTKQRGWAETLPTTHFRMNVGPSSRLGTKCGRSPQASSVCFEMAGQAPRGRTYFPRPPGHSLLGLKRAPTHPFVGCRQGLSEFSRLKVLVRSPFWGCPLLSRFMAVAPSCWVGHFFF